ncbi:TerL protein, partial [Escherichia coli]|nr:TerL protein [Escherichia coli]EIN2895353.1 TerL protein [Escherichia coli]EKA9539048.1 TerL protein [Escherichia coli]
LMELSQPTWSKNATGKILVDKQPDGTKSPNLADSVMIAYAPMEMPIVISDDFMEWI